MDDEAAVHAVLVPPQLKRFREICEVAGPIEPRFEGYTKHVLLTEDRAFLFPRNHTIVTQLEHESAVYATLDQPLVPRLLQRWDEPSISPYPFFAVTRLPGSKPDSLSPDRLPVLAAQLGAAVAACHNTSRDRIPRRLWTDPWSDPPAMFPTAIDCHSPLRQLGSDTEHLADSVASFIGAGSRETLLDALAATEAMDPVLAHSDLHADQLLLDAAGTLTGILDWGFGGVMSPLVDFTCSQWDSPSWAAERRYGDLRRHLWTAYASHRAAPVPSWEQVHLALTAFDIAVLDPQAKTHHYWQSSDEWRAARREAARDCLRTLLE